MQAAGRTHLGAGVGGVGCRGGVQHVTHHQHVVASTDGVRHNVAGAAVVGGSEGSKAGKHGVGIGSGNRGQGIGAGGIGGGEAGRSGSTRLQVPLPPSLKPPSLPPSLPPPTLPPPGLQAHNPTKVSKPHTEQIQPPPPTHSLTAECSLRTDPLPARLSCRQTTTPGSRRR